MQKVDPRRSGGNGLAGQPVSQSVDPTLSRACHLPPKPDPGGDHGGPDQWGGTPQLRLELRAPGVDVLVDEVDPPTHISASVRTQRPPGGSRSLATVEPEEYPPEAPAAAKVMYEKPPRAGAPGVMNEPHAGLADGTVPELPELMVDNGVLAGPDVIGKPPDLQ